MNAMQTETAPVQAQANTPTEALLDRLRSEMIRTLFDLRESGDYTPGPARLAMGFDLGSDIRVTIHMNAFTARTLDADELRALMPFEDDDQAEAEERGGALAA